ncbi:hypothetical protein TURU_088873 [Turdus rufiventris]|nr:hypothetical protein TURU_088873 [Turdus rufiventris]
MNPMTGGQLLILPLFLRDWQGRTGGGVAFYIKNWIEHEELSQKSSHKKVENLWDRDVLEKDLEKYTLPRLRLMATSIVSFAIVRWNLMLMAGFNKQHLSAERYIHKLFGGPKSEYSVTEKILTTLNETNNSFTHKPMTTAPFSSENVNLILTTDAIAV